jgi:hypothetical protein
MLEGSVLMTDLWNVLVYQIAKNQDLLNCNGDVRLEHPWWAR